MTFALVLVTLFLYELNKEKKLSTVMFNGLFQDNICDCLCFSILW